MGIQRSEITCERQVYRVHAHSLGLFCLIIEKGPFLDTFFSFFTVSCFPRTYSFYIGLNMFLQNDILHRFCPSMLHRAAINAPTQQHTHRRRSFYPNSLRVPA